MSTPAKHNPLQPILRRLHPDPNDARRLLMDDGRPVLAVVGGGHEQPLTRDEMKLVSAWVCECWNSCSVASGGISTPLEGGAA